MMDDFYTNTVKSPRTSLCPYRVIGSYRSYHKEAKPKTSMGQKIDGHKLFCTIQLIFRTPNAKSVHSDAIPIALAHTLALQDMMANHGKTTAGDLRLSKRGVLRILPQHKLP